MQYHNNSKDDSELLHSSTKDTCPGFPLKDQCTSCIVILHRKLKLTILSVIFESYINSIMHNVNTDM